MKKTFLMLTTIVCCLFFQSTKANSVDEPTNNILVFGDSLSAAYGIEINQGWVHLLSVGLQELSSSKSIEHRYQISNASISGETTTGGLARIELTLEEFQPDLVILALGANDGLQGHPLSTISSNLNKMLDIIKANNAQAVIFGISIPASYGPRYIDQFRQIFPTIAAERKLPYFDLYQEDFFLKPGFIQNDGLHPTAMAHPIVKDLILDFLLSRNLVN